MPETKITKLPKSLVEIEGELSGEIFESYWDKAVKHLGEKVEIDGFRKGKVPEAVLLSKIPEISILEEMAEMALAENYPKIVKENKIDAIGRPEIILTKIARKSPLAFKIKVAVLPLVKLPDYKKLAKEINSSLTDEEKNISVTEEDVEKTIEDIRKSRSKKEHNHADHEGHEHVDEPLKPFDDEFVKSLGDFINVEDFKTKLRANIQIEKENIAKEKHRIKIIEKIVEKAEADLPEVLINAELHKMLYRLESDVTNMGLKLDDYLKHMKKTIDDIKKEWVGDAEKRAKIELIIGKISGEEKVEADKEAVDLEVAKILEYYKDADPARARMHVENVLMNEKVFKMLESQ